MDHTCLFYSPHVISSSLDHILSSRKNNIKTWPLLPKHHSYVMLKQSNIHDPIPFTYARKQLLPCTFMTNIKGNILGCHCGILLLSFPGISLKICFSYCCSSILFIQDPLIVSMEIGYFNLKFIPTMLITYIQTENI